MLVRRAAATALFLLILGLSPVAAMSLPIEPVRSTVTMVQSVAASMPSLPVSGSSQNLLRAQSDDSQSSRSRISGRSGRGIVKLVIGAVVLLFVGIRALFGGGGTRV